MKLYVKFLLISGLAVLMLAGLCGCSRTADYSGNAAYSHLFTETDDDAAKQLKNVIIEQLDAYNAGDAEGYYALFNMEKDDFNFNVAQFQSLRQNTVLTCTPESIETAFINEDNAQAMITMTCRAEDSTTGEVLYYYRTTVTYTMARDGKWKITQQTPGSEEDLMDTLNTDTAAQ